MSELATVNRSLPTTLNDLSKFVLIGREKLNSVRAEIRAIQKIGLAEEVRKQKLAEAQDIAEAVLDAEVRIGQLMSQVPKTSGGDRRSENFKNRTAAKFEKPDPSKIDPELVFGDRLNDEEDDATDWDDIFAEETTEEPPAEKEPQKTKAEMIAESGFTKDQVNRFETLAKHPDLVAKAKAEARENEDIVSRTLVLNMAKAEQKKLHKEEKVQRKAYSLEEEIPDGYCTLFCEDIRAGLAQVPDNSIDYIITDPPYAKEYTPLYNDLSKLAVRVLKPSGSLIVMTGQSYLPEVIERLSENMEYHWCMAYETPGGQAPQLFQKKVNTFWKPVLWFVKGKYDGDWVGDVLKSPVNENDKRFHEWGQTLGGMKDIVERFTNPGDLILDPFLGGGTTGVAAITMNRKFIGVDIEQKNVDTSDSRIKEAYAACLK